MSGIFTVGKKIKIKATQPLALHTQEQQFLIGKKYNQSSREIEIANVEDDGLWSFRKVREELWNY